MKHIDLQACTADELVQEFANLALSQGEAELWDNIPKYNLLYRRMKFVEQELKRRSADQRSKLVPLQQHPHAQVRLMAAIATLAIAPEVSRETLRLISDRNEYPQAADARGMLRALDEGTYIPL